MVLGDVLVDRRPAESELGNIAKRLRRDSIHELRFQEVDTVATEGGVSVCVPVVKGDLYALPARVQRFIAENVALCEPSGIYICDGSADECEEIKQKMVARGMLVKLPKYANCYQCRTDPADVARVEGRTFIVTEHQHQSVPHVRDGVRGILGQWMSPKEAACKLNERFPGCMKGRVMYVIPFSMGPVGSPMSKIGVQLTDSNYVVLSMRVMTRMTSRVWDVLGDGEFVECIHSIGAPRPVTRPIINHWPCNPEKTLITHFPAHRRIMSYGSGYGGNSLLGKKCFALRIASAIARDEGWLAEHMMIMSVTNPAGEQKYIAAAFPSACGKTNLSMMKPTLPGWEVRCIGDDIAWMRFDENGRLRAINPEAGFFGVAPGTNNRTNPMAMETIQKDCIFTNVALTDDGGVYWEGLEKEVDKNIGITTWRGEPFRIGETEGKAAHPNSRFCVPASRCPIIDPLWEDPAGVPIDAIVFGGRRPEGVPLVMEAFDWPHAVMLGAAIKSEATASAEHTGKVIMHDPMAMRPFMGYNFGQYLQHWLSLQKPGTRLPRCFHVNWFRLNKQGKFLWPGFGENIRAIDWIFRRCNGEEIAESSPIGLLPKAGSINTSGLGEVDMKELFSIPKDYWMEDIRETRRFFEEQVGEDLPPQIHSELAKQQQRIDSI